MLMAPVVAESAKYMLQTGDMQFLECVVDAFLLEDISVCLKEGAERHYRILKPDEYELRF